MSGVTGVDVEHTKALEAAATPGEWQPSRDARKGGPFLNVIADPRRDGWRERVATALNPADAEFIAHARTAVPALVAAVERVQALHEPLKLFLLDDDGSVDYSKPFDTLCRGCTDPDIVNAWECDDGDPGDDYVQHPCPTIEALEIK
ncbi:hypothetical protein [Rhodococcus qingshengii]|uniref:hypothetical protein n=1 Tax=Rhodococcus qingshengii TaxID=334542 RepID=UPI001AE01F15|nr:hypothetical protein [Rhodococcus qingshengii]MCQ4148708.1 hypothetical protein [Rhodococcus qingshengii]